MKFADATIEQFRSASNAIVLKEQSFAFTLNHYKNGKLVHTASYSSFAQAMRAARSAGMQSTTAQTFFNVHNELRIVTSWD